MRWFWLSLLVATTAYAGAPDLGTHSQSTELVKSIAAWKRCLESPDHYVSCTLARGTYDVGDGLTITMPLRTATPLERIYALCDGAHLYSTSATVTQVVNIDMTEMDHDHEVYFEGCAIDGSTGTTSEHLLTFTKNDGTPTNQTGRIFVDRLDGGESGAAGGTERGIYFDFADDKPEAEIRITNSKIGAAGHVFEVTTAGTTTHVWMNNITLEGTGSGGTVAANECVRLNLDPTETLLGSSTSALFMDNVRMRNCGGIEAVIGSVFIDNTTAFRIGDATEDGAMFRFDAFTVNVNATVETGNSEGPIFFLLNNITSLKAVLQDAGGQFDDADIEVVEIDDAGGAFSPTDVDVKVMGNGSFTLPHPYGAGLLAAADLGNTIARVDLFGMQYDLYKSNAVTQYAPGLQPFSMTFGWNPISLYANCPTAPAGVCTEPPDNLGGTMCGGKALAGLTCVDAGVINAGSYWPLNPTHPTIVNTTECFSEGTAAVTGANAGDEFDAELMWTDTIAGDGTWTKVGGTLGTTGPGRITFDATASGAGVQGDSTGAAVLTGAYGLRMVGVVSTDPDESISSAATGSQMICFVRGWN